MIDHDELANRTMAWIEGDPDPDTRRQLQALLDAEDWDELFERMDGVLEFGTAGLRGAVEAGSNRMNRAVVIRATAGLAAFLERHRSGPVVLGFDGRLSSETFARDAVGVLAAAGHQVRYFPHPVPTPIVAYAAQRMEAASAVVITASHNPPADNGYKVYDSNAAQIIPPVDGQIADAIAAVGRADQVPRREFVMGAEAEGIGVLDYDETYAAYRADVNGVRRRRQGSDLAVAYTPMHGVGWETLSRLTGDAGYPNVEAVPEQREPDGRFPTVSFPNPEEPGAMDLVEALGTRSGADLVIANDPDADRLAVSLPDAGGWRPLTGNQIGVLLADWLLEGWEGPEVPIVVNSIVSSPMLASVAKLHGAHFEQTLTGFKWIANAALELEGRGVGRFVFGYEEALGYSVGRQVRDKDGLSAALIFMDMAAALKEQGRDVSSRLADLYRRTGLWVSTQLSVVRPGAEGERQIAEAMRRIGAELPSELDGRPVVGSTDFRRGAEERPAWLAATPLVAIDLDGGGRVLVRPSGTEPKLKIYVDLPGEAGDDIRQSEAALTRDADQVAAEAAAFIGL